MTAMLLKLKEVVTNHKDDVKSSQVSKRSKKRFVAGTSMEGFSYTMAMTPFKIIGL
ncbi:MAG: hypothetical protein GX197_03405 [Firmicutes bacterium]|nr:hypothetical protein [Bacillota bacterium]